jgi:hypothetical protein
MKGGRKMDVSYIEMIDAPENLQTAIHKFMEQYKEAELLTIKKIAYGKHDITYIAYLTYANACVTLRLKVFGDLEFKVDENSMNIGDIYEFINQKPEWFQYRKEE